jgi:hypothetical protein
MIYEVTKIIDSSNINVNKNDEELKNFFINEIKILEWLNETNDYRKIIFKDRTEYKVGNKYHRLTGPAIEFYNGGGLYYINNELLDENTFKHKALMLNRKEKLKKIL